MDIPRMGLPDQLASRLSMAEQHDLLRKRRASRRGVLTAGAAAVGAVAAAGTGNTRRQHLSDTVA